MKFIGQRFSLKYESTLLNQVAIRVDYLDVSSNRFTAPCQIHIESAVKQFFFSIPKPFLWMLVFREAVGKRLGLKTAKGKKETLKEIELFTGQVGDKIALFEVWSRSEKEILTGQRDKHLDFVLSFHLDKIDERYTLHLITAVQLNSRLGRIYFYLVKPIHKLLMPILAKRLSGQLASSCQHRTNIP
jgi:hypothetical protein